MAVRPSARAAHERLRVRHHFAGVQPEALVLRPGPRFALFLLHELPVDAGSLVQRAPNAAQLGNGSEERPLQFVDVMVEHIAALDEGRSLRVDC